jgi:putative Holliday junction resolvase
MILGIDPGERRVGLAVADLETGFARPLEVIDRSRTDAVTRIGDVIRELGVTRVVVGRPVGLSGIEGPAMEQQKTFLVSLRAALDIEVDVFDERLTTVLAEQGMRAGGASAKKRKEMRDAVAAQVMLQGYLDSRGSDRRR